MPQIIKKKIGKLKFFDYFIQQNGINMCPQVLPIFVGMVALHTVEILLLKFGIYVSALYKHSLQLSQKVLEFLSGQC